MDCLWLIGLFGWLTGCSHTRRKNIGCFATRNRTHSATLATFEHSQITRISSDSVEIQPNVETAHLRKCRQYSAAHRDTRWPWRQLYVLSPRHHVPNWAHDLPSFFSVVDQCSPDNFRYFFHSICYCISTPDEWFYLISSSFLHSASSIMTQN